MRYVPAVRTTLLLSLLAAACGPREGDVYEDLETGARYTVEDVNDCDFVRQFVTPEDVGLGSYAGGGTCIHLRQVDGFPPRGEIDRLIGATEFIASRSQFRQRFRAL